MYLFDNHSSNSFIRVFVIFIFPIIYTIIISSSSSIHGTRNGIHLQNNLYSYKIDKYTTSNQILHDIIREKVNIVTKMITNENERPSLDPYNLDSLFIILNDEHSHLNASITSINFHGLSHMQLQDIASNMKTKRVGALLLFPNIKVTGYYKIHGVWFSDRKNNNLTDKGRFSIQINQWQSSWSAKVHDLVNHTIKVSQMAVRSYYDGVSHEFTSYISATKVNGTNSLTQLVSSVILDKVSKIVDEKFEQLFGSVVIERSPRPKNDLKDWAKEFRHHKSRHKRQVPCEVGEELDEYVDSLFRFARRLLRVMEPFQLPNATIDLEEYNLQLFLHSGGASRIYTIERKKPAWVMCTNETISLGLTVQIEEIRVMYKYRVIKDWKLLYDGELEAQIIRPKVQLQFTQTVPKESEGDEPVEEEEPVMQRIDRLKIWRPGQIRVIIRGLGNLTQAISMIINSMLSNTESLDPIIKMIETDGVAAANMLLKNISIPFFSII